MLIMQAAVHHAVSQHKSHTVVVEHLLLVAIEEHPDRSTSTLANHRCTMCPYGAATAAELEHHIIGHKVGDHKI
jgi:hypothetical protein